MCDQQPGLEIALVMLVAAFDEHAGPNQTLSKCELKKLLKEELPVLCAQGDQKQLDDIFHTLDDGDGEMNFLEYMTLMTTFSCVVLDGIRGIKRPSH